MEKEFIQACETGNLNEAKALLEKNPTINISAKNEEAFRWACGSGHLEVAQWLLQIKPDINISANDDYAFIRACANGYLEVAQWLLSAKNECAFRWACYEGHLHVAQWLRSLKPFQYIIVAYGNPYIIPQNASNTLALITFLQTKGYTPCLTADLVCAIAKNQ